MRGFLITMVRERWCGEEMIPGIMEGGSDGQKVVTEVEDYFFLSDLVGGGKILKGACVHCLEVRGLYVTHG